MKKMMIDYNTYFLSSIKKILLFLFNTIYLSLHGLGKEYNH